MLLLYNIPIMIVNHTTECSSLQIQQVQQLPNGNHKIISLIETPGQNVLTARVNYIITTWKWLQNHGWILF